MRKFLFTLLFAAVSIGAAIGQNYEQDIDSEEMDLHSKHKSSLSSSKVYQVGDYYHENGKEGVVFWVDSTGKFGKIISLRESSPIAWATFNVNEEAITGEQQSLISADEIKRFIGADSENNGIDNMTKVLQRPSWRKLYPAFQWCADMGEGWHLPSIEELKLFTLNKSVHTAVNQTLEIKGDKLADLGSIHCYWSSTESKNNNSGYYYAWFVLMDVAEACDDYKFNKCYVRAVASVVFDSDYQQFTEIKAKKKEIEENNEPPFIRVEQMPTFQGGDLMKFRAWAQGSLRYPQIAKENGISGQVLLSFVIERDGTLTNIEVLQSPHSLLSEEAIRVLNSSPLWAPGRQRDRAVRVKFIMPLRFMLQ